MRLVTSSTVFSDAIGTRISITYSEVDDHGKVIKDNIRLDRVITDPDAKATANNLLAFAQELVDESN